jgi:hypothetical protein
MKISLNFFSLPPDALKKYLSFQLCILGYRLICKDPGAGKSLSPGSQQFYRRKDDSAGLAAAAAQGQTANVASVAARALTGGLVACEAAARYGECVPFAAVHTFYWPQQNFYFLTEFSSAFKIDDVFSAFRIRKASIRIRILLFSSLAFRMPISLKLLLS